jgi:mRNA interferase MazF
MASRANLEPGCVVVAELAGARVTKFRPAVVVSSNLYHRQRLDTIAGILTTQQPRPEAETDYLLLDWEQAGLRAPSWFRLYLITDRTAPGELDRPSLGAGLDGRSGMLATRLAVGTRTSWSGPSAS